MIFIFGWCLCIYTVDELGSIVDRFDLLIFLCFSIITINVVAIHTFDRFPWQELFGAIALNLYICYLLRNYLCGRCSTFTCVCLAVIFPVWLDLELVAVIGCKTTLCKCCSFCRCDRCDLCPWRTGCIFFYIQTVAVDIAFLLPCQLHGVSLDGFGFEILNSCRFGQYCYGIGTIGVCIFAALCIVSNDGISIFFIAG